MVRTLHCSLTFRLATMLARLVLNLNDPDNDMTNQWRPRLPGIGRRYSTLIPRPLWTMLEIPLAAKLFAANLVIAGVALLLMFGTSRLQPERLIDGYIDGYIVVAALTLGATVSVLMVRVDPRLTRLSNTNNEMLERLTT